MGERTGNETIIDDVLALRDEDVDSIPAVATIGEIRALLRERNALRDEIKSLRGALEVIALEGDPWASQWALAVLSETSGSRG